MSERLLSALESSRGEIEAALREAEEELAALDARREELERLIRRGRAALGSDTPSRRLTLHEAMREILAEQEDRSLRVHELAAEINRRGLYRKRDGSPVEANQVHARAKNYPSLFDKDGAVVHLRDDAES